MRGGPKIVLRHPQSGEGQGAPKAVGKSQVRWAGKAGFRGKLSRAGYTRR